MTNKIWLGCASLIFCIIPTNLTSQELWEKAQKFIGSLSTDLQQQLLYDFADEGRTSFHFVPMSRRGPTFHDFDENQRDLALELLRSSLSSEGYRKGSEIMELENVLIIMDQYPMPDGSLARDPLNYHFNIFGKPGPNEFWGWSFEGHHLSLNFTAERASIVSSTPSFMGSNPGIVPIEKDKGKQVLRKESQLALSLVQSLTEAQLAKAKFSDTAPREILTGNRKEITTLEPKGILYSQFTPDQQESFLELLEVYIGNYIFDFAESFRKKIMDAGVEHLYFAWAGGLEWGQPHYYRIQGPTLLIEYDNIQNNANHVHTVVRDLTNDFAEDILREHYLKEHHD
jgi:hypothetical protein